MDFGVAVIGCGNMGTLHAKAWNARPDSKVVRVYDCDMARAQRLSAECAGSVAGSYREAIGDPAVNVVSVCTPVCFHPEHALCSIESAKNVLVEKPIALSAADAQRMIDAARKHGVKLGVSYQYRNIPKYRKYRELIDSGELARPLFARFVDIREVRPKLAMHRRSMNGGPLVDMAGHYFDLMRFFTKSEPVSVYAKGHVFGKGKKRLDGIDDLAIDAAEVTVTYEHGDILSVFVNWGMPESHPEHTMEMLVSPHSRAWPEGDTLAVQHADRRVNYRLESAPFGPQARIEDLIRAIRTNTQPEVSGTEALAALRVCLGALESIETGRQVELSFPEKGDAR